MPTPDHGKAKADRSEKLLDTRERILGFNDGRFGFPEGVYTSQPVTNQQKRKLPQSFSSETKLRLAEWLNRQKCLLPSLTKENFIPGSHSGSRESTPASCLLTSDLHTPVTTYGPTPTQ